MYPRPSRSRKLRDRSYSRILPSRMVRHIILVPPKMRIVNSFRLLSRLPTAILAEGHSVMFGKLTTLARNMEMPSLKFVSRSFDFIVY